MPDFFPQHNTPPLPKIVVIVGPTAVGKTDLSIRLAEQYGGEIVNADSRLFYRGMNIGTAKPSLEQMERVRHHLIDILNPNDPVSLATVQDLAFEALDEIAARGVFPILVGGTPQYVNAIVENWKIPRVEPDQELRDELQREENENPGVLISRLREVDPVGAEKHAGNTRRVIRALEVYNATGQPITALQGKGEPRYNALQLELWRPREELYKRIDQRVQAQITSGLLDEVRVLIENGTDPSSGSFASIGYRQVLPWLNGESTTEAVAERIKLDTHKLVRHQDTWWRKNSQLVRIDLTDPTATSQIEACLNDFLYAHQ